MIVVHQSYRVVDVDLLPSQFSVVVLQSILVAIFNYDVCVHRIPGRFMILKSQTFSSYISIFFFFF